jgi:hypothetical protein
MRKYQPIVIVGVVALLAVACQSAPPSAEQVVQPTQPAIEAATFPQENQSSAPTSEPIVPVDLEPGPLVVVRTGLAATNPANVNLATGTPKLVEFFAFW